METTRLEVLKAGADLDRFHLVFFPTHTSRQ